MGGDYSRMTFKPDHDYRGVLKQQGRVGLDADHNELVDIVDRRWRAESIDIMGRTVVPISDPDNRHAFEILPSGPSQFTIGRGRMYVDGLQIECRGAPPMEYDARLGETRGTNPLPSSDQPYYPNAPLAPGSGVGDTDLVYVDAWEREVTAVEDPGLREIALGGPDTATRIQTVWQVRVLDDVGSVGCPDPIGRWETLIAPSSGRLTAQAVQPPASDDPCILSPTGGYRGLENRLYRIEIHDGDVVGAARFKWSRDNGSILTEVEAIQGGNQLTVRRIGRDANLRFRIGDWVEITDDPTEFDLTAGFMAQVTNIDDAHRVITVDRPVPATFDATQPANHTRIRRWDQSVGVDADGLLAVAAGPIAIEDGIEVLFGPNGGTLKAGDYWVFAARTADGSIEELTDAPPRGVLHHYARLALITWANPWQQSVVSDCRDLWPPGGCCTEVVWPGEDIQAAIDRLPDAGGCVCLKAGVHRIRTMLRIRRPRVELHGESIGAIVRGDDPQALLHISADDVSVHDIRFEVIGRGARAVIVIDNGMDVAIHDCELIAQVEGGPNTTIVGVIVTGGTTATIERNEIREVSVGVLAMKAPRIDVIDNRVFARTARLAGGAIPWGLAGVATISVFGPCRVEQNELEGFWVGVYLSRESALSVIARNRITRFGTANMAPVAALQQLIPTLDPALELFAIDCAAPGAVISANTIDVANERQGGIHVLGPMTRIEENQVGSNLKVWAMPSPRAIFLDAPTDNDRISESIVRENVLTGPQTGIEVRAVAAVGAERVQIIDNLYRGVRMPVGFAGGFAVRAPVLRNSRVARNEIAFAPVAVGLGARTAMPGNIVVGNRIVDGNFGCVFIAQSALNASDNVISRAAVVGIALDRATHAQVSHNAIDTSPIGVFSLAGVSVTVRSNTITDGRVGVSAAREIALVIDGNRLEDLTTNAIFAFAVVGLSIRHNHVARCAHEIVPGGFQFGAAIFSALASTTTIESCDVLDTGLQPDGTLLAAMTFAILGLIVANVRVRANRIDNPILEALPVHFGITLAIGTRADVGDNAVSGAGGQPLIEARQFIFGPALLRFADVICSGNRCVQQILGPAFPGSASISLGASHLSAANNQVRASTPAYASFQTFANPRISAMGNITSGQWLLSAASLFAPALAPSNHIQVP
jgi:nitrous oxidase accessory protein NosD